MNATQTNLKTAARSAELRGANPQRPGDATAPAPEPTGSAPAGSPSIHAPGEVLKPGYRTTEFWLTAILLAAYAAGVLGGVLTGQEGAACALASTTLYKGLRTWLKVAATGFSPGSLAQQLEELDPVGRVPAGGTELK